MVPLVPGTALVDLDPQFNRSIVDSAQTGKPLGVKTSAFSPFCFLYCFARIPQYLDNVACPFLLFGFHLQLFSAMPDQVSDTLLNPSQLVVQLVPARVVISHQVAAELIQDASG